MFAGFDSFTRQMHVSLPTQKSWPKSWREWILVVIVANSLPKCLPTEGGEKGDRRTLQSQQLRSSDHTRKFLVVMHNNDALKL